MNRNTITLGPSHPAISSHSIGWIASSWRLALVVALAAGGCSSSAGVAGGERQACYGNGTCNSGLVCLSQTCVSPTSMDANGAGGNSSSGGNPGDAGGTGGVATGTADEGRDATCTYSLLDAAGRPAKGRSAKVSLMWAPKAKLVEANDVYLKRHAEASAIKGDVLALAWIGSPSDGKAGDWRASAKLLAAVLQKL